MADDELERLRALFEHAHDPEKPGALRKVWLRIKGRVCPPIESSEPKPKPTKDEAA
jgi:hypothetical protein